MRTRERKKERGRERRREGGREGGRKEGKKKGRKERSVKHFQKNVQYKEWHNHRGFDSYTGGAAHKFRSSYCYIKAISML